jgi:hypothetical protein
MLSVLRLYSFDYDADKESNYLLGDEKSTSCF